eukprot:CAMPEP_0195062044 /NCGR_PEP_ID=MMETSP0448-20130528/8764_1 /TAXON_ID=66468 /ORGANISM="Heterocapsa triquestra, Strain CCMP 448" /LENGTH=501 /DNA_ID=CAMNT_0040092673 /DNA_START=116 /DNA_END=1621 /DNA_ORIENTATION=+
MTSPMSSATPRVGGGISPYTVSPHTASHYSASMPKMHQSGVQSVMAPQTKPPMSAPVHTFQHNRGAVAATFSPGEEVEARWGKGDSDVWFPATIVQISGDGTFLVDWKDGNTHGRMKQLRDLRRPTGNVASVSQQAPPLAAPSVTPQAAPQVFARTMAPPSSSGSPTSAFFPDGSAAAHTTTGYETTWETPRVRPLVAEPLSQDAVKSRGSCNSAASSLTVAPEASSPQSAAPASTATAAGPGEASEVGGSPFSAATAAPPCTEPPSVEATPTAAAEAAARPKPQEDVKVLMCEKANGDKCVVVERSDGKRWRFEKTSIEFELQCDVESLKAWLDGISDQQMLGLLALLSGEVSDRGANLKEKEKERDSLRGEEDYDYFGLNGEKCSDKDIERAYRKKSTQLHPDKGGDEAAFNAMREKYDQIKKLRGENKRKEGGGGSIKWDPNSRESMLEAHSELREQLVWITKHLTDVQRELEELQLRNTVRRTIGWDPQAETQPSVA